MKHVLTIILACLLLTACQTKKPDLYINGVGYDTVRRCVKYHSEVVWEYHYGLSYNGRFELFYGPNEYEICDEIKIDTFLVKTQLTK